MKIISLCLLFIVISASSTFVQANDELQLKCSDPIVRLSPVKLPCILDGKRPIDFDIPSLKIDFNDLEKIFQGAESSGGHIVSPMGMPRTARSMTPFPMLFNCKASLLSDGGKTISFLSEQTFQLDGKKHSQFLYNDSWRHFLIEGNDFSVTPKHKINTRPNISLDNYQVSLRYKKHGNKEKLILSVCEGNLSTTDLKKTSSCAVIEKTLSAKYYRVQLKSIIDDRDQNLLIAKSLRVKCKRTL